MGTIHNTLHSATQNSNSLGKDSNKMKRKKKENFSKELFVHWTEVIVTGNNIPSGRYAHTMASIGKKIYVFGGYTGNYDDDKLYIFDTETLRWDCPKVTGQLPCGRAFHSCAVIGTRIYYFGGYNGSTNFNDIHFFETDKMNWQQVRVSGILPCPRFEQQLTSVGNYLFLFGGGSTFGNRFLNAVHVFDTDSMVWGVAPVTGKPPKGRCAHIFTAVDKSIIVYGGFDGKNRLKDTQVFSAETASWLSLPTSNSPGKRAAHVACYLGNNLFIFGGHDGKLRLNDVFVLNIEKMRWFSPVISGTPPSPRSYHSACVVGKCLFIFGGYDGTSRSNSMFILEEVLPSLVQLCLSCISKNKKLVGNFNHLPLELQEQIELREK